MERNGSFPLGQKQAKCEQLGSWSPLRYGDEGTGKIGSAALAGGAGGIQVANIKLYPYNLSTFFVYLKLQ